MVDHEAFVLVVHGIGEQKKGEALKHAVEGFLPLIRNRVDCTVTVTARPLDGEGDDEVIFEFHGPSEVIGERSDRTKERYTLTFREVWWAHAFHPPALGSLLIGLVRGLRHHFSGRRYPPMGFLPFIWRLVWEGSSRLIMNLIKVLLVPIFIAFLAVVFGCRLFIYVGRAVPPPFRWLWVPFRWLTSTSQRASVRGFLWDAQRALLDQLSEYQAVIVATAVVIFCPVIILLLVILWILESPIPRTALPKSVRGVHRYFVNILTNNYGDMWLYLYQPWEASRIRARFEESFEGMTQELSARRPNLDAVMIIAHSMGSTVAYEALTAKRLAAAVDKFVALHRPKLYFVSVGSALNLSWDAAPQDEFYRFSKPLSPAFDWLNVWAEYDPAGGQPLRLPSSAFQSRISAWTPGYVAPLSQREVVNQMDLFSDHSAYWNNAEEVVAPLLDLLTAGSLSDDLRMNILGRRERVRILSAFKSLAWLIPGIVLLASFWVPGMALDDLQWVEPAIEWAGEKIGSGVEDLGWIPDSASHIASRVGDAVEPLVSWVDLPFHRLDDVVVWMGDQVPNWLRDFADTVYPDQAEVHQSIALGIESALLAWLLYSTVVKWAWDLWDTARKYERP